MCMDVVNKELCNRPCLFAISGEKNSGKTTLITMLIPRLKELGLRVATIKHDGHDFESDVPGTDSYKHQKAGAYATAVFSSKRLLITKEQEGISEVDLIHAFPEADIILLEGFKHSAYPKYWCEYPKSLPDVEKVQQMIFDILEKRLGF